MLELQKKSTHERRFQQVHSGAKNCIFIRTTLQDPLPLSLAIMDNIIQTQKQQTKRLLRMVPVQKTCKAYAEDVEKAVEELANSYFEKEGKSFYVVIKIRNNNSVKREELTVSLVKIMQDVNPKNIPDMKTPEVVLNVDVIKNICCISFLPEYLTKYGKYNLVVLANKNKEGKISEVSTKDGGNVDKNESSNKEAKVSDASLEGGDASHTKDDAKGEAVCQQAADQSEKCNSGTKSIQTEASRTGDTITPE